MKILSFLVETFAFPVGIFALLVKIPAIMVETFASLVKILAILTIIFSLSSRNISSPVKVLDTHGRTIWGKPFIKMVLSLVIGAPNGLYTGLLT